MNLGTHISSSIAIAVPASSRYPTIADHLQWCVDWWNAVSPGIANEAYQFCLCGSDASTSSIMFALKFAVPRSLDMFTEPSAGAGAVSMPYLSHIQGTFTTGFNAIHTGDSFKWGSNFYTTLDAWVTATGANPTWKVVATNTPVVEEDEEEPPTSVDTPVGDIVASILQGENISTLLTSNQAAFAEHAENLMRVYQHVITEF